MTLTDAALAAEVAQEAGELLLAVRDEIGFYDPYDLGDAGDRRANTLILDRLRDERPTTPCCPRRRPTTCPASRPTASGSSTRSTAPASSRCPATPTGRSHRAVAARRRSARRLITDAAVALPALGEVYRTDTVPAPPPRADGPIRIAASATGRRRCCGGCATASTSSWWGSDRRAPRPWLSSAATSTPTSTPAASGSGTRRRRRAWCRRRPARDTPRRLTADLQPLRPVPARLPDVPGGAGRCAARGHPVGIQEPVTAGMNRPVAVSITRRCLESTPCNRGRHRPFRLCRPGSAAAPLRQRRPSGPSVSPRRDRHHVRLRHHPVRRHPPRPRRHLPDVRPGPPGVAGLRPSACTTCRTSPTSTTRCSSGRARRHRLARARRPGDPAVPRGHGGAAGAAAARLRRRHRGHRRGHRGRREAARLGRGLRRRRRRIPRRLLPRRCHRRSSATSRGTTATPCCGCSPSAAATPTGRARATPLDALLWRAERPGEPSWPSPFGPGRPGWHVECAAIALSRIGTGLDIQGGGSDLIFPHHEFSAAHAESVTGERRFARHYVHAGMIGWDGHKMSKSRGQPGAGVRAARRRRRSRGHPAGAVRRALPRRPVWTRAVLDEASARLQRWRSARPPCPPVPTPADVVGPGAPLSRRRSRHAQSACRT